MEFYDPRFVEPAFGLWFLDYMVLQILENQLMDPIFELFILSLLPP